MKNRPFRQRLGFAFAGLSMVWRRERSFRTQVACAAVVLAALVALHPAAVWCALLAVAVALVLACEALNAALEYLADHLHPDIASEIGHAKDAAAGAVLVTSIAALIVGAAMVADTIF